MQPITLSYPVDLLNIALCHFHVLMLFKVLGVALSLKCDLPFLALQKIINSEFVILQNCFMLLTVNKQDKVKT